MNPTLSLDAPGTSGRLSDPREKLGRGPLRGARRTTPRRQAVLELTAGDDAGKRFEILARDAADGGLAFMLKQPLGVGQACRITTETDAGTSTGADDGRVFDARIVRSRPISNGRYELAAHFQQA